MGTPRTFTEPWGHPGDIHGTLSIPAHGKPHGRKGARRKAGGEIKRGGKRVEREKKGKERPAPHPAGFTARLRSQTAVLWQKPLPPRNSHRSGGRSGSLEPAGMPHKKCPWLWEPGRSPLKDFLGSGSQGQSPKLCPRQREQAENPLRDRSPRGGSRREPPNRSIPVAVGARVTP